MAEVYVLLEFFGRGPSGLNRPVRERADGNATLSALGPIVEQKALRPAWGEAECEALHVGVP